MSFPLNYAIRETEGALKGNLGWLFTMYYLHCDGVLRCYPSNELLKKETGIAHDATIQKHRDTLIAMKAIIAVPVEKRLTEKEKALHPRRFVYQITGIMELPDGKIIPTVYINSPEELATQAALLEDLGFDTKLFWSAFGKDNPSQESEKGAAIIEGNHPSKNEVTILQKLQPAKTEDEVVTSLEEKVIQEKLVTTTPPPPENGGEDAGNTVEESDPELDAMIAAVKKECKPTKKQLTTIAKLLLCRFKGKDADKNIMRPITPNQLTAWALDWDKSTVDKKTGKSLTRPCNQGSVQKWVNLWLDELDAKTNGVQPVVSRADSRSQNYNNHHRPNEADYAVPNTPLPTNALSRLKEMAAVPKVKS
jgi:hypothetical protein